MRTASVIINNYNYGCYLGSAIDSVLAQSHAPIDIVVVDDGSTDNSVDIINAYGDRITPVFKRNGGQGSAFNAGIKFARGDAVFFLDSDDELLPHTVETVLGSWKSGVVLMQYRMRVVDQNGQVPGTHPPLSDRLADGDVRDEILETGSFPTTITSGLAFSREALLKIMPVDEQRFRMATDGFLVRGVGLQGPVQALEQCLAIHRLHGKNDSFFHADHDGMLRSIRKQMHFREMEISAIPELASQFGLKAAQDMLDKDPYYLYHSMLSMALDSDGHPGPQQSMFRLWKQYCCASWKTDYTLAYRVIEIGFTSIVLLLPHKMVHTLLQYRRIPDSRPAWLQLVHNRLSQGVSRTPQPRTPERSR